MHLPVTAGMDGQRSILFQEKGRLFQHRHVGSVREIAQCVILAKLRRGDAAIYLPLQCAT